MVKKNLYVGCWLFDSVFPPFENHGPNQIKLESRWISTIRRLLMSFGIMKLAKGDEKKGRELRRNHVWERAVTRQRLGRHMSWEKEGRKGNPTPNIVETPTKPLSGFRFTFPRLWASAAVLYSIQFHLIMLSLYLSFSLSLCLSSVFLLSLLRHFTTSTSPPWSKF